MRVGPFGRRASLRWYFDHNDGRLIHKWLHYFEIYERHFERFRGRPVQVLEIGVFHGGSLEMWRWYFGRRSTVVGIDIDERTRELAGPGIDVRIGDQSDPEFLRSLVDEYGAFDIVIDDGSHRSDHQIATLEALWPHLADDAVYLVEDLHTSYWPHLDGGRGRPGTFVEYAKDRIDDLHAFHSRDEAFVPTEWTRTLDGLHVYDSITVLERRRRDIPEHRMTGRPSFDTTSGRPTEELIDEAHRRQLEALGRPSARLRRIARDPVAAWARWRARRSG